MRATLTLHSPRLASAYYAQGLWRDDTFYSLLVANARSRGEAIALVDHSQSLTWQQLLQRVDALAMNFESFDLVEGDRVSLWMSDRAAVLIAFLACSRLGLACNPSLHKTYTCGEVAELLTAIDAAVLITEPGWGADRAHCDLQKILNECSPIRHVLTPDNFPSVGIPVNPSQGDADGLAYLAFTSGTTGKPKCVMHSANTLLANSRDLVDTWGVNDSTRLLCLSPFSHHIAWVAAGQWLLSGCRLIMGTPPAQQHPFDWIVDTGTTYVMGVPTHAMDILAEQKRRKCNRLGVVDVFYMAGAPIPEVVAQAFVMQGIRPQNVYGMTENSSHQFTHPNDSQSIWTSTCGRGGGGYRVKIVDADDVNRDLGTGEIGQIVGQGANLMLGYLGNQAATEQSFNRDGWFLSGDLGSLDEAGNLRVEGRLKDLIIRGGHNIHPSRIEALALRHSQVVKAAAFPIPDERLGERVCLAIEGAIEAYDMCEFLALQGLSIYDMPEWFVRVEAFPLTPSGKILKRSLVEQHREGVLRPLPVRWRASSSA